MHELDKNGFRVRELTIMDYVHELCIRQGNLMNRMRRAGLDVAVDIRHGPQCFAASGVRPC